MSNLDNQLKLINEINKLEDLIKKMKENLNIANIRLTGYSSKSKDEVADQVIQLEKNIPKKQKELSNLKETLFNLIISNTQLPSGQISDLEEKLQNLRTQYIENGLTLDNLKTGLKELRQTVSASASAPSKPNTFMGRLAQRFTANNEGKSFEDQLEEIPDELNTILGKEFENKNTSAKNSRTPIDYKKVEEAVNNLDDDSFAGGKIKRKTNKRKKYSNKRKKNSNKKKYSKKRKASRRK